MFLDKFCLGKVAKFGGQSLNGSDVIQLLHDCLGKIKNVWTILRGLISSLPLVLILFTVCFRGVIVASAAPKKGDSSYPLTRDE